MAAYILNGKIQIFEPNGPKTFPQFRIAPLSNYSPGRSNTDGYEIVEKVAADSSEVRTLHSTWLDVERSFSESFSREFRERFPGPSYLTSDGTFRPKD